MQALNKHGQKPIDIAMHLGHEHCAEILRMKPPPIEPRKRPPPQNLKVDQNSYLKPLEPVLTAETATDDEESTTVVPDSPVSKPEQAGSPKKAEEPDSPVSQNNSMNKKSSNTASGGHQLPDFLQLLTKPANHARTFT